jgi:hypothetical protein
VSERFVFVLSFCSISLAAERLQKLLAVSLCALAVFSSVLSLQLVPAAMAMNAAQPAGCHHHRNQTPAPVSYNCCKTHYRAAIVCFRVMHEAPLITLLDAGFVPVSPKPPDASCPISLRPGDSPPVTALRI